MRSLWLLALSLALLALPTGAHAQPPWGGERPFIDLDEDGTTDFTLKSTSMVGNEDVTSFEVMIRPKDENRVVARKGTETEIGEKERFVAAFERGALIGKALPDTLEWASDVPPEIYDFVSNLAVPWQGPWPSETPQYLGLKLVKDGNTYYGWAHLRLDRKYQWAVSIREKAYNSRSGPSVQAGHMQ
jgi:hypothetical protein